MGEWTRAEVQDRLESAAGVMRQLPGVTPQGYFNAWPEYLHGFADKVGQEPEMKRPRPTPRDISQAEEAMLWLRWLETDDARHRVAAGQPGSAWKPIGWRDRAEPPGHSPPPLASTRVSADRVAPERAAGAEEAVAKLACGKDSTWIGGGLGIAFTLHRAVRQELRVCPTSFSTC